ncbi:MAG: aldo/keto reductase [Chloroflexi bacterium]|nr:aldo/keto reductase [Chloroflexota bacterium]MBP8058133.1 aldo/keto reductase [Chloroflexota bacterium]
MIPQHPFGRTGHNSTRTLFGAAALGRVTQAEADQTLDLLLEYGVNHIDVAASYGDAELRVGPWMRTYRDQFFLATKTEKRTYREAKEELHRSLARLQVSQIDLWQMHILVNPDEWQVAMGPGGALEAFIEAREQGLVRFLGVTGHGVTIADMHRQSLERFDFDTVLLPYNYAMMQNRAYAAAFASLLTLCQERNVAVQTIKSLTRGPWGDKPRTHSTWYEPFTDQNEIDTAIHWVLNRPGIFLDTVGDIHLLPLVLDAASRFVARPQAELDATIAQIPMEPLFM